MIMDEILVKISGNNKPLRRRPMGRPPKQLKENRISSSAEQIREILKLEEEEGTTHSWHCRNS